ncbi:transporter substrate-binding domain-containing protein [Undibacterium sp. TS12]|uniref:substrate-binding periplasmic protein n=1 Tax=Undibacterium sp. TS12 TaxID=2908202 RepID=UPI001F4C7B90|nr:transporter substrate-binding domain-containing protein [Undibacterium sp. TS12]MCH8621082.1 transporter substrate-binding domain-containing protein [Undibacterium sp. TS12]
MMLRIKLLLLLNCCLFAQQVLSQDKPACLSHPIRYGVFDSGYYYHDGKGMDVDIANELYTRTGCRFEVIVLPIARQWFAMRNGELDMIATAVRTPEREGMAYFFSMHYATPFLISLAMLPPDIQSMEGLLKSPDFTVGVQRKVDHGPYLESIIAQFRKQNRLIEATDTRALVRMLNANRFMVALSYPMSYRATAEQMGLANRLQTYDLSLPQTGEFSSLALSKKTFDPVEAGKWHELIRDMHRDGTVKSILGKYLPPSESPRAVME